MELYFALADGMDKLALGNVMFLIQQTMLGNLSNLLLQVQFDYLCKILFNYYKTTSISGRYQAGVTSYKGNVYAIGGCDAWNCLSSVECYDSEVNLWTPVAPLLTPRRGCGVAVYNGKLYTVGGSDGTHTLSSTEIYDDESKTWVCK